MKDVVTEAALWRVNQSTLKLFRNTERMGKGRLSKRICRGWIITMREAMEEMD